MATQLSEIKARQGTQSSPLDDLLSRPVSTRFDPDVWHVMQARDDQLIRYSVLHGAIIKDYVYSFSIKGAPVTGVSVVGARQLAVEYKGIKSRLVGSAEKTGPMFVFRAFDPMSISVQHIPELANEPDFYECILEISDIKTGNAIQVRKKELKQETKRDGGKYDRPHYDVIAESKAFRNGVLSIIPQDVISEFETKALKAGNGSKETTIEQRREALQAFATKNGIKVARQSLQSLSFAELDGLSDAAKGGKATFLAACISAGLAEEPKQEQVIPEPGEVVQQEAQQAPAWTPNDAAAELENADSEDRVNEILDRARSTFKKAHMMALQPFADKRLVELRGAQ